MELITYLNSLPPADRESFAARCSTSIGYLRKAVSAKQTIGPAICTAIEKASSGAVTRRDLRPSDWWLIWPELVTADHPAPTSEAA